MKNSFAPWIDAVGRRRETAAVTCPGRRFAVQQSPVWLVLGYRITVTLIPRSSSFHARSAVRAGRLQAAAVARQARSPRERPACRVLGAQRRRCVGEAFVERDHSQFVLRQTEMNVINRQTFPLGKFGGDFGQIDRADQGVWKMLDDALPTGFAADDREQC